MIALLDYGAGNVGSVLKAIRYLGYDARTADNPAVLETADKVILPGQGHFQSMMERITDRGLLEPLRQWIALDKPYLGICLGLQALYEGSDEAPRVPGLGFLRGRVRRFEGVNKVPQVGWNQLQIRDGGGLFKGIGEGSFVYYCHSYYGQVTEETTAVTEYSQTYAAGAERGKVRAVQFHPEKSGDVGLKVLKNFLEA